MLKHGLTLLTGIVICLEVATPAGLSGQSGLSANDRAVAIVEAGLGAMNVGAVDSIRNLHLVGRGYRNWNGQGDSPRDPISRMPETLDLVLDIEGGRIYRKQSTYQEGEPYFGSVVVVTPESSFRVDPETNVYDQLPQGAAQGFLQQNISGLAGLHGRISVALENRDSLTYRGEELFQGSPHHVVGFPLRGTMVSLLFDAVSMLPRAFRVDDSTEFALSEGSSVEIYEDYRNVAGVLVPHHIERTNRRPPVGDVIHTIMDYELIEANVDIDERLFEPPVSYNERMPTDVMTMSEIVDGVWFVENTARGYNQMVVEFDEYLLVVDAPRGTQESMDAMTMMREQISDKPIRYIVPTHFHYDHIGGLPAYVSAEGATVVTTPGNADFFDNLIERTSDVVDDVEIGEWTTELVTDEMAITDGDTRVELYNVRVLPHVEEMLIAYLPEHKLLFVADVFSRDWGYVRPAIPETRSFALELSRLGLEIETILPGHGPRSTMSDLLYSFATAQRPKDVK